MIRAVLVVGWLALALLASSALTGLAVAHDGEGYDDATAQRHMIVSLFASGALLLSSLTVATYLLATRRMTRRAARELGRGAATAGRHGAPAIRGALWAAAAAVPVLVVFLSGFPVYSELLPRWVHQALAAATAVLQTLFLVLGGRALAEAERILAAFAEEVEGVRYTPTPSERAPAESP